MSDGQDTNRLTISSIDEHVGKAVNGLTSGGTSEPRAEQRFASKAVQSLLDSIEESNAEFRSTPFVVRSGFAEFVGSSANELRLS